MGNSITLTYKVYKPCICEGLGNIGGLAHSVKSNGGSVEIFMIEGINAYAAMHNNIDIRLASQSGGAFTAISDIILDMGGVVYGCALGKENRAIHTRAVTKEERDFFRGSKYVQSDMGNCYTRIAEDLKQGKQVLFSGTPCQVDGLQSFLSILWGKDYNWKKSLLSVDIVCHGVPSPLIFREYLQFLKNKYGGEVENFNFRNKMKFGWQSHVETFSINGEEYYNEEYAFLFYGHNTMRQACFRCPYKRVEHPSDLTIADCWGVDNALDGFNDGKGTSLILVNTSRGMNIFESIQKEMKMHRIDINQCMQETFIRPWEEPFTRSKFWKDYKNHSFQWIVNKYGREHIYEKIRSDPSRVVRKIRSLLNIKRGRG